MKIIFKKRHFLLKNDNESAPQSAPSSQTLILEGVSDLSFFYTSPFSRRYCNIYFFMWDQLYSFSPTRRPLIAKYEERDPT